MSEDRNNPYASPIFAGKPGAAMDPEKIDERTLKKIHSIVKDADQFWIAILLCLICSGIGMILIGPWYFVRLMQWRTVASDHPELLDPNLPPGSLARRFRGAKTKLIIGLSFGGVILALASLFIAVTVFSINTPG